MISEVISRITILPTAQSLRKVREPLKRWSHSMLSQKCSISLKGTSKDARNMNRDFARPEKKRRETTKNPLRQSKQVLSGSRCTDKDCEINQSEYSYAKAPQSRDSFNLAAIATENLVFGTLYPAYCSYKAIRTKNVKEYVRWMMHWVVFACFVACETISDVFLSWFPFYYEVKVLIVLWLLSPVTKGSSILYKKFIHPKLSRHEQEIDEYINQAKERGYKAVIDVGTKTFDYASKLIVETAIKGVHTIKKSYSLSDLSQTDGASEIFLQEFAPVKHRPRPKAVTGLSVSTRSSSLTKRPTSELYFSEVEFKSAGRKSESDYSYVKSADDVSSGYSSTMDLSRSELSRTASNASLRSKRPSRDPMSVSSTLPRRRASEKTKVQRATK